MRNFLDESCKENENAHFMFSNFFPENLACCEIMSKKYVESQKGRR
jgi:hypothetical protein